MECLLSPIDPNIRPNVIGDARAWRPRFERLLARCAIVKASVEDLAFLYGAGVDARARARHWLTARPKLVILTRGGDGASVFLGNSTFDLPVRKVHVIDTVGAGDSFHAAMLVSLEEQNLLRPARNREFIAGCRHACHELRGRGVVNYLFASGRGSAGICRCRGHPQPMMRQPLA
jgi:fructokinase